MLNDGLTSDKYYYQPREPERYKQGELYPTATVTSPPPSNPPGQPTYSPTKLFHVHNLLAGYGRYPDSTTQCNISYYGTRDKWEEEMGGFAKDAVLGLKINPILPYKLNGVQRREGKQGDYTRGLSKQFDAASFDKVDEGNISADSKALHSDYYMTPYYQGRGIMETGPSYFSPNKQLPSAVMFGSIPTAGAPVSDPDNSTLKPWQTLLFRPEHDTSTTTSHPGARSFPDHLLLDLFHIPVVEPYAISEPFSTAGKVNLNSVLAPFGYARGGQGVNPQSKNTARSYIRRDTALRGLLKSTKVMMVPTGAKLAAHEEGGVVSGSDSMPKFRWNIDLDKTIDVMERRIKDTNMGLFRSASEICEVDLYPKPEQAFSAKTGFSNLNPDSSSWLSFWDNFAETGDNMRERPYAHLYPRVTTKSNVYTIHMRCQSIKKGKVTQENPANKFDGKKDSIAGEYRGSTTIERFIDPNDPNLDITLSNISSKRLDDYYRFRVVATKQFSPR